MPGTCLLLRSRAVRRSYVIRPSYVVVFLVLAFAYAGCLFPALMLACALLWLCAPSLVLGRIVRNLASRPGARR